MITDHCISSKNEHYIHSYSNIKTQWHSYYAESQAGIKRQGENISLN